MKVRNFIIENRSLFMDNLEKELCQNGISYVRIDNEIHFLDQIIRFYDIEMDKQSIINWFFVKEIKKQEMKVPTFSEIDIDSLTKQSPLNYDLNLKHFNINNNTSFQTRNHKIQKQESHKVKQLLKKYSK